MKSVSSSALLVCLVLSFGCQNETKVSENGTSSSMPAGSTIKVNQMVEASCGECQFEMEGDGCDLAVRIDGNSYYVDGAVMDDHGDAHGDDGMCNCIRQAKVTGQIKDGRFAATSFELLPVDKVQQQAAIEKRLRKSRIGAEFVMTGEGLVVKNIWQEGAGAKAGLKKGDRIVKLNSKTVADLEPTAIRDILMDSASVDFSIRRGDEAIDVSVQLPKERF
jgi:hypothetical protein